MCFIWQQVQQSVKAPGPLVFCCFSKLCIFYFFAIFFFVFVNMGPYGRKKVKRHLLWKYITDSLTWDHMGEKTSNDILIESTQQICPPPQILAYSWEGSLPKLCKELWNFKFWIFWSFLVLFFGAFNMVANGELYQNFGLWGKHLVHTW